MKTVTRDGFYLVNLSNPGKYIIIYVGKDNCLH